MSFVYRDTNFAKYEVSTYADLLEVIRKAVEFFVDDDDIKMFYSWLQQLPETYDYSQDTDSNKHHTHTYENIKDSKESQRGIVEILKGFCEALVIDKKVWVLGGNGLVQLCKDVSNPGLAVVPLWCPYLNTISLVGSLHWLREVYDFAYEVVPNVTMYMGSDRYQRKVVSIISTSDISQHRSNVCDFINYIANKRACYISLFGKTVLTVSEDGKAIVYKQCTRWVKRADAARFIVVQRPKYTMHLI